METASEKNQSGARILFFAGLLVLLFLVVYRLFFGPEINKPFYFSGFGQAEEKIIEEASQMEKSRDPNWWLNSGGFLYVQADYFSTNFGKLAENSSWRKLYAKNNPRDTDKGYYPQNLFRLVTRGQWKNLSQEVYFQIAKINLSDSSYRNESNGVLLFNRYQDGDDLYYAGLRVDGDAVIKKKTGGKYYTMAEQKVFPSEQKYDREKNPNLIPEQSWLGIKSEVKTNIWGEVRIRLYLDRTQKGEWQLILEATDQPEKYGPKTIREAGHAGIRTDFLDARFKNYRIGEL